MTEDEIRLKCLELALNEAKCGCLDQKEILQTAWIWSRFVSSGDAEALAKMPLYKEVMGES